MRRRCDGRGAEVGATGCVKSWKRTRWRRRGNRALLIRLAVQAGRQAAAIGAGPRRRGVTRSVGPGDDLRAPGPPRVATTTIRWSPSGRWVPRDLVRPNDWRRDLALLAEGQLGPSASAIWCNPDLPRPTPLRPPPPGRRASSATQRSQEHDRPGLARCVPAASSRRIAGPGTTSIPRTSTSLSMPYLSSQPDRLPPVLRSNDMGMNLSPTGSPHEQGQEPIGSVARSSRLDIVPPVTMIHGNSGRRRAVIHPRAQRGRDDRGARRTGRPRPTCRRYTVRSGEALPAPTRASEHRWSRILVDVVVVARVWGSCESFLWRLDPRGRRSALRPTAMVPFRGSSPKIRAGSSRRADRAVGGDPPGRDAVRVEERQSLLSPGAVGIFHVPPNRLLVGEVERALVGPRRRHASVATAFQSAAWLSLSERRRKTYCSPLKSAVRSGSS